MADIGEAMQDLQGRVVAFDDEDLPGLKTVNHVCVLGVEKAAWFKDPDGNILCLHEPLEVTDRNDIVDLDDVDPSTRMSVRRRRSPT